ncbi:flavin reductase family protein [Actinomadura sp. DC4]|uniref:flavin reductase family protein n=1 Tax=Actinomadura sp. DC4 TaxID=3055069 RepID=UPI0025AEE6FA|nr:flavin reductase family protein [Actinomadura sp. DC4]MDN3354466.1 flavin reductase family protein [Actinomadura sp. DC4]
MTRVRDAVGRLAVDADRVAADDHRELMSRFPAGVAIVTTADRDGVPYGLTCTAFASVGLDPPTLLVCLHRDSRTLRALRSRGAFAVHLLDADSADTAASFAERDGDPFAVVAWAPSARFGIPIVSGRTVGHAECVVAGSTDASDHVVVFGEVVATSLGAGDPMVYGLREFVRWPGRPAS